VLADVYRRGQAPQNIGSNDAFDLAPAADSSSHTSRSNLPLTAETNSKNGDTNSYVDPRLQRRVSQPVEPSSRRRMRATPVIIATGDVAASVTANMSAADGSKDMELPSRQSITLPLGKGEEEGEGDACAILPRAHDHMDGRSPRNGENANSVRMPGECSSEESEEESEESEEESDDDNLVAMKPVFVAAANRKSVPLDVLKSREDEASAQALAKRLEERRLQTLESVAKSQLHAAAANDDDDANGQSGGNGQVAVDDWDPVEGDGLQEEVALWQQREKARVIRQLKLQVEKEWRESEKQRRAAMSNADRRLEDAEREAAWKAVQEKEKEMEKMGEDGKTKKKSISFLQKYYHRGAFFSDEVHVDKAVALAPTGEDVVDKKSLPAVMQVRNYGKKGRSKYTHLADQDTSERHRQY
jgi:microfibrillar-associated protein 1